MADHHPSAIYRTFINENSPRGELEPCRVPGIGLAQIQKLRSNGVETFDQLLGQFFQFDRDEARFLEYLEDVGIQNTPARACASAMSKKYEYI